MVVRGGGAGENSAVKGKTGAVETATAPSSLKIIQIMTIIILMVPNLRWITVQAEFPAVRMIRAGDGERNAGVFPAILPGEGWIG
jgi:hypothetical protein